MTRDEQKSITGFIERAVEPHAGSQPVLDVEADAIIRALFVRNPEAAYWITMLAMAQAEQLAHVKNELAAERKNFRGNWLSRLLQKPEATQRGPRRDPQLSVFRQNLRGR